MSLLGSSSQNYGLEMDPSEGNNGVGAYSSDMVSVTPPPQPWTISEGNSHCLAVMDRLCIQRKQGRYCDLVLLIQGRHFPAHRCVLATCSTWFDSKLKMHKTVKEEITVHCQNLELFYAVLTYCYTGQIIIDRHVVDELLYLSDYFGIVKLKNHCCEYLGRNINGRNVFNTFDISIKYGLSEVQKQSLIFLQRNFDFLFHREEMLSLSLQKVQILISERLWRMSQERVLTFLAQWVASDVQVRELHYPSLLHYVIWNEVDIGFLCDHIDQEPLFQSCAEALFSILHILEKQNIYLGPKFQDLYQSLQDKLLPEQALDELNDTNSFLSMAINSAVKDLEHSEVDPDWFLQNEPPTNDSTQPGGSQAMTLLPKQHTTEKQEKYKDMDFEIVEQVINEQRLSEEKSKYRDASTSVKRYDPKFRALNEVFRQMEEGLEEDRTQPEPLQQQQQFEEASEPPPPPPPATTPVMVGPKHHHPRAENSSMDEATATASSTSSSHNTLLHAKNVVAHQQWGAPPTPSPPLTPSVPSPTPPEPLSSRTNLKLGPGTSNVDYSTQSLIPDFTSVRCEGETTLGSPARGEEQHHHDVHQAHQSDPQHIEFMVPSQPAVTSTPLHLNKTSSLCCSEDGSSGKFNLSAGSCAGSDQILKKRRHHLFVPDPIKESEKEGNIPTSKDDVSPAASCQMQAVPVAAAAVATETVAAQAEHPKKAKLLAEHRSQKLIEEEEEELECEQKKLEEAKDESKPTGVDASPSVYPCDFCDFKSKWRKDTRLHIKNKHIQGPPYECDFEGCQFRNVKLYLVLNHRKIHSDARTFSCPHSNCEFIAKTKYSLAAHKMTHEKKYSCQICAKRFPTRTSLEIHAISHTSERVFSCSECAFETKYKSHLNLHRRMHNGAAFRCAYGDGDCDYSTPKKSLLQAHMKTHTKVKDFVCEQCQRAFVEKSQLTRHMRIHSDELPFACHQCDFKTRRKDKLKNHVARLHSKQESAS